MSLVGNFTTNDDRQLSYNGAQARAHRKGDNGWYGRNNGPDGSSQETLVSDGRDDAEVLSIARRVTQQAGTDKGPFGDTSPELDPHSEKFNAKAWVSSLLSIAKQDSGRFPQRTSGIAFRNLSVHGYGTDADYQKTVGNFPFQIYGKFQELFGLGKRKIDILHGFDGVVKAGELLVVLGPPGSGCSTLLKTISGETNGIYVSKDAQLNYQGISAEEMHTRFRGEAIYTAEVDEHFPQLTVGETLTFAASARMHKNRPDDVKRSDIANHLRDAVMAIFGISHTVNTRVGNDFVRGVSGGERKRVTVSEAVLSGAPLQCWDNSTRGLDSANSIEFCKTLRTASDVAGATAIVAIYQAPQAAYDYFDKVVLLYEGRCCFFGRTTEAKAYFEDMGFHCPARQTIPDFLTSLTSPGERRPKEGFENRVPRTPDEFARVWKASPQYAALQRELDAYEKEHPLGGQDLQQFKTSVQAQKGKHTRGKSPYMLSYWGQVKLCTWRGFLRLKADPSLTATQLFGNTAMALIISSVFYNLAQTTESFFQRGAIIFFAILLNAFASALEILTLYAQRPIVEKHARYAFYHPSAEAAASMLTDLPYKIANAILFNVTIYFMVNLNRQAGNFFFFLLVNFLTTLTMSMVFRTIGASSRTLSQALAPAAVLILGLVLYTGFTLPTKDMLGWSRWINYLDPIAYAFEALMVNEFSGQQYACSAFVPSGGGPYAGVDGVNRVCSAVGSVAGSAVVDGNTYSKLLVGVRIMLTFAGTVNTAYAYYEANKWRNVGIVIAFIVFFMVTYLLASEFISAKKSKGEVLVFPRGHIPPAIKGDDVESGSTSKRPSEETGAEKADAIIEKQTAIFHWQDVVYDIKIKTETRRILDHVDGWVKPGTLTALMGASGAGKTTLLDVLAGRVTMGVITGEMMVDGQSRDNSFSRKTGYVQQQDLHLNTSTVREALRFSALLRQSKHVSKQEKLDYVEQILALLEMTEYADAVVGVPGEGLNVEQRKRLTIGVELVAKPELLLFLDEPTSGLDSQTSWSILDLMVKLRDNGQAILCTIHQPSAMLFQRFDKLLFLAKGGKTIYYGDIGENSKTMTGYFEANGASRCPPEANPAEWILQVCGAAPGAHTDQDWHQTWRDSKEYQEIREQLHEYKRMEPKRRSEDDEKAQQSEFAAPFGVQFVQVTRRVAQQLWRTPSYIYSKLALVAASALFIGFSLFKANDSQQGLQNKMFSIFLLFTIFGNLTQQIMPQFVTQRALYEVRERPSRTYSWLVFMVSNILVELPWNTLAAVVIFCCFYYPIGFEQNAVPTNTVHERGALFFLLVWSFLMFTSTFAHAVIAAVSTAETGGNIANLMFSLTLIFCGVLATPAVFPRFWIFLYRVSPFTYLVDGMLSVGLADSAVVCSSTELLTFQPPAAQTCLEYMQPYIQAAGGYLVNEGATADCQFCTSASTNAFLSSIGSDYSNRWRNFGIMLVYSVFNIAFAIFIYWLVRVPKQKKAPKKTS